VLLIALAQFASAAGNRFSDKFWSSRGGLPTLRWLCPGDAGHSTAQKQQWYAAIRHLTGLDIAGHLTARNGQISASEGRQVCEIVNYAGEWHSHPARCGPGASQTDRTALAKLADQMRFSSLPALMLIVADRNRHQFHTRQYDE
jgi:hypothetical protein